MYREEESLESLCRLLSTVGKALDEETKRKMESMSEEDVRKEVSLKKSSMQFYPNFYGT